MTGQESRGEYAGYTPGPWVVAESVDPLRDDEMSILGGETGEGCIAQVWPWGDDEAGIANQEANALLIAAAPDLLREAERNAEAMELAANMLRELDHPGAAASLELSASRTRAAIAKATEPQPEPSSRLLMYAKSM